MKVEIRKTGFVNKGAELMLHAVMQQVKARYPHATLVIRPTSAKGSQPFHKFAPLGFFPKASFRRKGVEFGELARLVPQEFREMYGVVLDREVDVVLDAAGFAYSDQWGPASSKELAVSSKKWKKNGTKVILLPQAFGPYNHLAVKKHVPEWADNVDLIFPREEDSYRYLTEVVGEQEKIKLFNDFTNLVKGRIPEGYESSDKKVALVPNHRMIDKVGKEESDAYLPFMIKCAECLVERKARPFILVHEGEADRSLANKISEAVGGIPIVLEADPLKIKGILGACEATIGSRFHGLVSALSQGVPSLATGWSHKYKRLFEDYGFSEGILSVLDSKDKVAAIIDMISAGESKVALKGRLEERSRTLKRQTEQMWEHVFYHMDQKA